MRAKMLNVGMNMQRRGIEKFHLKAFFSSLAVIKQNPGELPHINKCLTMFPFVSLHSNFKLQAHTLNTTIVGIHATRSANAQFHFPLHSSLINVSFFVAF